MESSITAALSKSALGARCSHSELKDLACELEIVDLPAGHTLFEAGAEADAAYVVLEGELDIIGPDGTWLDRDGPGALVGEQALLSDTTNQRNAKVASKEPTRLARVEARRFHELFAARTELRAQVEADSDAKTRNRLSRLSGPFSRLLAASERQVWEEGQALFHEGDEANGLHLILSGRAEVMVDRDGEPVHISTVYAGQCFGEIGTLKGIPRTATVVARAGLRTAFVPKDKVLALQDEHPDLMGFLQSLVRSYELPRRGALHQRSVFVDGETCIETLYDLSDGREVTALRSPRGTYTLTVVGAVVHKEMEVAAGTVVRLDESHRIVGLEDAGQYEDLAGLHALALDGEALSVKQRRALRSAAREAALQAPDAVICRCLGIDRSTLESAIADGCRTVDALRTATGCGSVCGSCVRKTVPQMLAEAPSAAPASPSTPGLPATVGRPLPKLPRFVPWLGNFSFSRDPAGFQRRGHARIGPVFGAKMMGTEFAFIDPNAQPELLARVLAPSAEGLDAAGAWHLLVGRLLGDTPFEVRPDLGVQGPVPSALEGSALAVSRAVDTDTPVSLSELTSDAVCAFLATLAGRTDPPELLEEIARLVDHIGSDDSAVGALMPLETASMRQRLEARRALLRLVGPQLMSTLVATARNATLAATATLVDLVQHPEVLARVVDEVRSVRLDTLEGLGAVPRLSAAISASIRRHAGGAIWRLAQSPVELDGITIPAGTMVGTVMELAHRPDPSNDTYAPDSPVPLRAGGPGAVFDESFGTRGPTEALPELVTTVVVAQALQAADFTLDQAPKRWLLPIVPGMASPDKAPRVAVAMRD